MDNVKNIISALAHISNKPEVWTANFYQSEIKFWSNFKDSFVVARSLVNGLGLDRSSQFRKIKTFLGGWLGPLPDSYGTKILLLHRDLVQKYLNSISLVNLPQEKRNHVFKYQTEFLDFMNKETCTNADLKGVDEYIGSKFGIQQLVIDSVQRLGNKAAIEGITGILWELLTNENLSDQELRVSNRVHMIAENIAKHRPKLARAG